MKQIATKLASTFPRWLAVERMCHQATIMLSVLATSMICTIGVSVIAQDQVTAKSEPSTARPKFDMEALSRVPQMYLTDEQPAEGVKAFFYDGPEYQGRPTRVFAYYGVPKQSDVNPAKFPAMVLIHGGGGSAFDRWVKLWNQRGYAAIAMDLCGCIPKGSYGKWQRHEKGGPPGWDASFQQLETPVGDQWTMQAVSSVILAHSLLRSFPEVDENRIGVTGISWGGYLTCIVAGVDQRFKAAAPVYGCGYLGDNSAWLPAFEKMGPDKSHLWLEQWDPSKYLIDAHMPMLWVNGTNDFAYPMDSWQKSYRLPPSSRLLALRIRMPHGHGVAGENPEEIHTFMNSILKSGQPLPQIVSQNFQLNSRHLEVSFRSEVEIEKAELCVTTQSGKWVDRLWKAVPAQLDTAKKMASAKVPEDAVAIYLNLFDSRGNVVSSEHLELGVLVEPISAL